MRKRIVLLLLTVLAVAAVPDDGPQLRRRQILPPAKEPSQTPTPPSNTPPTRPDPGVSSTPVQPGGLSTPTPSASSPAQSNSSPTSDPNAQSSSPISSPISSLPPSSTPSQTSQAPQTTDPPLPSDTNVPPTDPNSTVTVISSNNAQTSDLAPTSSADTKGAGGGGGGGGGVGTGTIIGLSVAGGVAALAVIGFIIWKLTRKRFPDFDAEDNEAIKWPELNNNHAASPAEDLSRAPSNAPSDPYAVPPLPHFNPSQPYRDDPRAANAAAYYDPYRGPVPQAFQDEMGENIQMRPYPPSLRTESPAPNMVGRASPGPVRMGTPMAGGVGRTISPGPGAVLGGPQYVSGVQPEMARHHSPGPNPYS